MPRKRAKVLTGEFDLAKYIERRTELVNQALDSFLPGEKTKPATIHKAMRYSLFAGGKRMRPALCLAAAEACGGSAVDALPLACAVECIQTHQLECFFRSSAALMVQPNFGLLPNTARK